MEEEIEKQVDEREFIIFSSSADIESEYAAVIKELNKAKSEIKDIKESLYGKFAAKHKSISNEIRTLMSYPELKYVSPPILKFIDENEKMTDSIWNYFMSVQQLQVLLESLLKLVRENKPIKIRMVDYK